MSGRKVSGDKTRKAARPRRTVPIQDRMAQARARRAEALAGSKPAPMPSDTADALRGKEEATIQPVAEKTAPPVEDPAPERASEPARRTARPFVQLASATITVLLLALALIAVATKEPDQTQQIATGPGPVFGPEPDALAQPAFDALTLTAPPVTAGPQPARTRPAALPVPEAATSPSVVSPPMPLREPRVEGAATPAASGPVPPTGPRLSSQRPAPRPFTPPTAADRLAASEDVSRAAPLFLRDVDVAVHIPRLASDPVVAEVESQAIRAGFDIGDPTIVGFTIANNNVRYYHPADRADAQDLARATGATLRDFTDYRPSPPQGRIELWIEGRGGVTRRARQADPGPLSGLRRDLRQFGRDIRGVLGGR